MIKPTER